MSSEIIKCKECGQEFDTLDSLKKKEKSEQEDKELQNKGASNLVEKGTLWTYIMQSIIPIRLKR